MISYKDKVRSELNKIYSQDLINIMFSYPYTKIIQIEQKIEVTRLTATKYLNELSRIGFF